MCKWSHGRISTKMSGMTVGSLFAGIGGIDIGFAQAGFEIAWAIENDPDSCETYRANFKNIPLVEQDVRKIDADALPPVDVLAAGFPCQAFSVGGKQQGFQDDRGNLFFEVTKFIKSHKPRVVFLENVANLVHHDDGHTFCTIYTTLVECGYYVRYRIMRASEYGNIPQIRDRIYIVAFRHIESCDRFQFPKPIELKQTADMIIERKRFVGNAHYYTDNSAFAVKARQIVSNCNAIYRVYHNSIKAVKGGMCPTLTAAMGTQNNQIPLIRDNFGVRKLTLRECLRFQGFPETFGFPGSVPHKTRYKQIGNSVCVPVVKRIAESIKAAVP